MVEEKMIQKIEKLLAKANRAGSPEEADAFFEGAQALMVKWQIEDAMLNSHRSEAERETPTKVDVPVKRSGFFQSMVRLYAVVAEANNVKVLVKNPSQWKELAGVVLIGFPSDIERTKMLYTSLLIQVTRESNRSISDETRAAGDRAMASWRRSFRFSYADRIGERLAEIARASEADEVSESSGSMALVLVDRRAEVENFYDGISKGKGRRTRRQHDAAAGSAGRSAANRADLGQTRVKSGGGGALGR